MREVCGLADWWHVGNLEVAQGFCAAYQSGAFTEEADPKILGALLVALFFSSSGELAHRPGARLASGDVQPRETLAPRDPLAAPPRPSPGRPIETHEYS